MRLLVFSALISVCRCFNPQLETRNERNGPPPRYIYDKDEYLRQIGPNARVSYANPFLQYQHPYVPAIGYSQYSNAIRPYVSSVRQQLLLPNDISIPRSNDAFLQIPQNPPTLRTTPIVDVGNRNYGFNANQPGVPIKLGETPNEKIRYLQAIYPINKDTSGMKTTEQPVLNFDVIQQRRNLNSPTVFTSRQGFDPTQSRSLNSGDKRVSNSPDMRYIMYSIYNNINLQNDLEEILNYVIGLMLSDNYLSPGVIQAITNAKNIDLSKLNEIDVAKLGKLSYQDITYLKHFLVKILNVYGLSNFTFKLMEYLYLIGGTPISEVQLLLKILNDDGTRQQLNRDELQQLKRHLLRIYDDYNESPYMLAFLDDILKTRFRPSDNDDLPTPDVDDGNNKIRNEQQEIIDFIIKIMISENKISSNIIKVLKSAQNIDFFDVDKLTHTKLDTHTDTDLARLKKYLIQAVNLFGLTPYTLKLLEYVYILEGRPIVESHLMSLILSDDTAVKKFTKEELKLIHDHLLQIYTDYNESPYILAFLKNIIDKQFKVIIKDKPTDIDSDDNDVTNDTEKDMQNIYIHLSNTYNNNPNILKILKIINDIYTYAGSDVMLPIIDRNDLQSLTTVKSEDLNLLVKYILQVESQKGDNIYFNGILSYINWIQNSKREEDVPDTNHKNKTFNATEEKVDLSPVYIYLLDLNNSKSTEHIFVILNRLSQKRLPVTTLYSIETLGYGDLITLKEFLLQNKSVELSPAILDFISKLNQAIQKQEAKVILEGDQMVEITPDDLELLKKYMASRQTAVPDYYLKEILQLIKRAQNPKDMKGFGKLKYFELMQIYKYLLETQVGDTNNTVFIKIQQYVNENNHDVNVQKDSTYKKPPVNNVVTDSQINLEEFYNVLLQRSLVDKPNPLLVELLKYFNKTLLMHDGKLKIKILSVNSTKPEQRIRQDILEKLMPYLVHLKENSETENNYLYTEFLSYLKYKIPENNYDVINNPLYVIPSDVLYRIKIYLETFMREYGKNELVFKIILQLNEVLKSQQKGNNTQTIDDLNVKETDLKILLKYITAYVDVADSKSDLYNIIKYIEKSGKDIKNREKQEKEDEDNLFLIKLIGSDDITPTVKDILKLLIINKGNEDPNLVIANLKNSHKLDTLNTNEIQELLKYLQQIKTTLGPNKPIGILIDNILRLQKEKNELNNNKTMPTDEQRPEFDEKNKNDFKIPGKNVKIINKYLIDLFDQYYQDEDIVNILYKINRIEDGPEKNLQLIKSITSPNNIDFVMKIDDLRNITGLIINLINRHSINHVLMGMLQVIFNFDRLPAEDKIMSVLSVNDTDVLVTVDQKNLDQIRQYINTIAIKYKLIGYKFNLLPVVYAEENISTTIEQNNTGPNKIYTLVIRHDELRLLIKNILGLIHRYGVHPALINVLYFVCDIYKDDKMIVYEDNKVRPNDLVVSDEMEVLFQEGVIQKIRNMRIDSLKTLYTQLVQRLYELTIDGDNADTTLVIEALVDLYEKEVPPVNKYILLKLLAYLKNIDQIDYETIRRPDFVLVLLDITNKTSTVPPNSVYNMSNDEHENHEVIQPYDYKKDIQGSLTKVIKKMYQPDSNGNKLIVTNYTIYYNTSDDKIGVPSKSNITLEKNHTRFDFDENLQGNNTIGGMKENNIHGYTKTDIKVEKLDKPFYLDGNIKNVVYTIYEVSEDGIRKHTLPKIEVEKILNATDTKQRNKEVVINYDINENSDNGGGGRPVFNINAEKKHNASEPKGPYHLVTEYTVNEVSNDGFRRKTEPNLTTIANYTVYASKLNTNEKNKNILANDSAHENTERQSNINVEKNHERIDTEEHNKNIIGNNIIYEISNDKITHNSTKRTEGSHDVVTEYTISGMSENGFSSSTKTNTKVVKIFNPIDTNQKNSTIVANYTVYGISKDGARGHTLSIVEPINGNEENKNILANYTVIRVSNDGIRDRTLPSIELEKVVEPLATNEKNKNIIVNYTVYEINADGVRRRSQPNVKSIDTNEKNNDTSANYTIYDNTIGEGNRSRTQSNINVEKNYERIETKEHNKNIIGNNTIYEINKDEIHGQAPPIIKLEKFNIPLNEINEKNENVATNYKVYKISESVDNQGNNKHIHSSTINEMYKDRNSEQSPHSLKGMSCEQANMKFNLILSQLNKASNSNQRQIDLTLNEFLETYDILQKFKTILITESRTEIVTSSVLMRELEQRLLASNVDSCLYQPNVIVKTIISDLVKALREVIQYMKVNDYDEDRMKATVGTLINRLLPDINSIAVRDCEQQTPKELMSLLFSNVYSNKDFEVGEVQFATGYAIQGNSDEDFFHTLSMLRIQQEIAKYRNVVN